MPRLARPDDPHPLTESWEGGVHRLPIQMRFRDTDAFGHVNNVVYASWIEVARIAFMRGLEPPSGDLILAHLELDFLEQVTFGQRILVETRVAKIGRTSVTLDQRVYARDILASCVRSVVVLYDYEANEKRLVEGAFRDVLEQYLTSSNG